MFQSYLHKITTYPCINFARSEQALIYQIVNYFTKANMNKLSKPIVKILQHMIASKIDFVFANDCLKVPKLSREVKLCKEFSLNFKPDKNFDGKLDG